MISFFELATILVLIVSVGPIRHFLFLKRNGVREPPGPRPLFLLGNILDAPPAKEPHVDYARMAKKYGPVMRMRLLDKNLVILTSPKAVDDLLEKRGSIYSDRPQLPMAELWVCTRSQGWCASTGRRD